MSDQTPHPPHARAFLEMKAEEFQRWRHHPATAIFLKYLEDQAENFRACAADMLEEGTLLGLSEKNPNANPHFIRGKILTLRELCSLTLDEIQGFYKERYGEEQS